MIKKLQFTMFLFVISSSVSIAINSWQALIIAISILVYSYLVRGVSRETYNDVELRQRIEALETRSEFKNTLGGR